MSNDFNFPDNPQGQSSFSPSPYGQFNAAPPPKSGRRWWLFFCGGCLALVALICCCCVAGTFAVVRQPAFLAGIWGGTLSTETGYGTARTFVCPGSQAETYTNQLEAEKATLTNFSASQESGTDVIDVTATITRNGQSEPWAATIITGNGGTFGRCVESVREK